MKYVDIPSMLEADVEKAIRERVEDGCGQPVCTGELYGSVQYQKCIEKMEEER